MDKKHKICNQQIKGLVVSMVVGTGILSLPGVLANMIQNDGWIAIILGGFLTLPLIIVINKIFDLYPDKDFFQIGTEVLTTPIFNFILIIFAVYLILFTAYITRNFNEVIKAFLLDTTPSEIIIITFILACSYIARSEIEIIGRAGYHIYPIILGFIIFIIMITLPYSDFTNVLPAFQSNIRVLPKATIATFFSYSGFETLLFVVPYAEDRKKTLKYSLIGMGIVIAIYLSVFIITLSQYGVHVLQRQSWPTLSLVKEVNLPGYFLENLDGVAMALWVLVIFGSIAPAYYATGKTLSHLFNTKTHELFIIPLLPLIYIVSLIPQNPLELTKGLGLILNYLIIFFAFFMPFLIYAIGYYKVRRAKR